MSLAKFMMAVLLSSVVAAAQSKNGIDVLEAENFASLKPLVARHGGHLRLALMTDQAGMDIGQRRGVDVLHKDAALAVPGLTLLKLFTPEHGLRGCEVSSGSRGSSAAQQECARTN